MKNSFKISFVSFLFIIFVFSSCDLIPSDAGIPDLDDKKLSIPGKTLHVDGNDSDASETPRRVHGRRF